jgi:hypothetical protein
MCHLQPRPLEAALDVEPLVRLAAVENALVAAHLCRDEVERLDDFEAEFLALLVFRDGDVFDVADEAKVVDAGGWLARLLWNVGGKISRGAQFLLNDKCPGADYSLSVLNHEQVIGSFPLCIHEVVAFAELLFCDVTDGCQHS